MTITRETGRNIGRRTKNTPINAYTLSSCISQEGQMAILPPPVLTPEDTNLDKFETESEIAEQDTKKEQNPKAIKKGVTRPSSLIFPSCGKPTKKKDEI